MAVDAQQARLAEAGLASVDERDSTCCYARQDKFWVQGAPDGERWEIYTVLADSPTLCGQGGDQSWTEVQAKLDRSEPQAAALGTADPGTAERPSRCCGTAESEQPGVCRA